MTRQEQYRRAMILAAHRGGDPRNTAMAIERAAGFVNWLVTPDSPETLAKQKRLTQRWYERQAKLARLAIDAEITQPLPGIGIKRQAG